MDVLHARPDSKAKSGPAPARMEWVLRSRGLTLRLAADLPGLEACLALERRIPRQGVRRPVAEPTAVPFCDFLMARDSLGALQGVCRLLPRNPAELRHTLPGSPRPDDRPDFPHDFAPLLTALRYSSQSVLEVGELTLAPGADPVRTCAALWDGIEAQLGLPAEAGDRFAHFGYVLGGECMAVAEGMDPREIIRSLVEIHGLHPDLRFQSGPPAAADGIHPAPAGSAGVLACSLPLPLREALARGCRLMGPPRFLAGPDCLEFHWVASREMLAGPD